MADAVAWLPQTVKLVGGPYCGYFFHPHHGCLHDVHIDMTHIDGTWFGQGEVAPCESPSRWQPADGRSTLRVSGELGEAYYEQWSDEHWFIVNH